MLHASADSGSLVALLSGESALKQIHHGLQWCDEFVSGRTSPPR